MAPLNSTRLAWSIAIASLALWATSLFVGPVAWLVFWNVLLAAVLASA